MLADHPKYQEDCCTIYLLLNEYCLSDIGKYILQLRTQIINREIDTIKDFPNLIRFYLNYTNNNCVELYIEESKIRRSIHEFCERNNLISRSKYYPTPIKRLCDCCNTWSDHHVEGRGRAVFYCDQCEEQFGCSSSDGLEDLIEDKAVKCTYSCNGTMLIMKRNNIIPNYKKQGLCSYRKWKRKGKK